MIKKLVFFCVLSLSICHLVFAAEDAALYSEGFRAARRSDIDLAFMNFHRIVKLYPESRFAEKALFGIGEYYFTVGGYPEAYRIFKQYVSKYPESKQRIFALAYLFDIVSRVDNLKVADKLRTEIATCQQVSFIFRDSKVYKYYSPLAKRYKALHFIDKVEFYIDGVLLTQVTY